MMKKMHKYKKLLFVLLTCILFVPSITVNAVFQPPDEVDDEIEKTPNNASNNNTVITDDKEVVDEVDKTKYSVTCKNAADTQRYKVTTTFKEVVKGTRTNPEMVLEIVVKVNQGKFRILNIYEGYFDEDSGAFSKDDNTVRQKQITYLYGSKDDYIDESKLIIGSDNNPVTQKVYVKMTDQEDLKRAVVIELGLAETEVGVCQSYSDFKEAKRNGKNAGTIKLYAFIPIPKAGKIEVENNTQYDSAICKVVRGDDTNRPLTSVTKTTSNGSTTISISETDWNTYYNSTYTNMYKEYIPYCTSELVQSNYSDEQLINMLNSALKAAYFKNKSLAENPEAKKNFEDMKALATTKNPKDVISLKCKYKPIAESRVDGKYNYDNKNYYYWSSSNKEYVTYVYHLNGYKDGNGNEIEPKKQTKEVCTRTCEEVVEIAYGPPQAVTAGLCFEYQVRATSRTRCTAKVDEVLPDQISYCTPEPYCIHYNYNNFVNTQGGPSQDFDKCVKACDGGKYTQSCSRTCYNKIYGNGELTASSKNGPMYKNDILSEGFYIRVNGVIKWIGKGFARWYRDIDWKDYEDYEYDSDGFKRKNYGDHLCDGDCSHRGCSEDFYLNEEDISRDYDENMQSYSAAVTKCYAGATCSEKTGVFSISVDYETNTKKTQTYTDNMTSNNDNSALTNNAESPILSVKGCYNKTADDYYQTEWSFPGTWVNNKTGEISFENPNSNAWHRQEDKFCLPFNARDVNNDWWNYYYATNSNLATNGEGSYTSEEYEKECGSATNISYYENKLGVDEWNIHASTYREASKNAPTENEKSSDKGFGYFGWKVDIDCFYAASSRGFSMEINNEKCNAIMDNKRMNYNTRSVTNDNLFPSKENEQKEVSKSNYSETGRTPGFNWTQAATIGPKYEYTRDEDGKITSTTEVNKAYQVNPSTLIAKIQKTQDEIYDVEKEDIYLDYDFYLTPSALRDIRNDNKANGYTKWSGQTEYIKESNIWAYKSNLFRSVGTGKILKDDAIRQLGTIGVNNQASRGQNSNAEKLLNN